MNKAIFSALLVLACCLFNGIGTVKATKTYDISGQCVKISMPIGEPTTPEDVCLAAGYGHCHQAGGVFRTYITEDCIPPSLFKNGVDCSSVRNLAVPVFHKSAIVDTLICNQRTWGIVPQPSNVPGDFNQSIKNATDWILGFVAMIAVLMLIWGGINYLTSAGDEDKAKTGKKTVTYALIGLVLAGIAYAIVNVIITVIL